MAVRIQFRRGTAAEWTSADPTLAPGELGYETDTTKFKLGDGSTVWSSLGYGGINQADIDSAVANVVDSAPGALDTLNELAAALGDDANFGTTVTNSLANKISFVVDTSTNLSTANATSVANTMYIESDFPSYVRIGDGTTAYNDVPTVGFYETEDQVNTHNNTTTNVHGIANTADIAYVSTDIANVESLISDHENLTLGVHGISNTAELATQSDINAHESETSNVHGIANTLDIAYVSTDIADLSTDIANVASDLSDHETLTLGVHGITDTSDLLVSSDLNTHNAATTSVHGIEDTADLVVTADLGGASSTDLSHVAGVNSSIQDQFDAIPNTYTTASDLANTYAPLADATLTGTVSLPETTTIGSVSSTELGYISTVTSNVQNQLDAKLATSSAASIYAPIASPTLTGTVGLPADTSIGDVSATEISYLNNVSSAIQTQLDAKLASATASSTYAPIASPTFTTAATLPASTTIGDVSATEISYLNNVSSAIQTQLDAKAPIASPTFTGSAEAVDLTLTGNLYVQGSTTTISTSNLKLRDNMTYLNQAGLFDISGAAGDGTNVIYTTSTNHDYAAGDFVTVANTTPSSFDIGAGDGVEILAITDNTFTVASTVTDTYTSGGNARGKIHANPDLGWAAGRYTDNTYAHAGFFRDATDGTFKVFDGYVPEPDESAFIDTSHNTFALASFAAATVTAENVIAGTSVIFADSTVQTSAGVPSLTGFTEKTASYTLDTLDHQDNVVEVNSASATTFTIPTNDELAWPVGASMDIIQTGAGQVTISPISGVTLNYTPGNKLRTQWSSCTILKRGTDSWIVYGDLTA